MLQTARRTPLTETDSVLPDVNHEVPPAYFNTPKNLSKKKSLAIKRRAPLAASTDTASLLNCYNAPQLDLATRRRSFFCRQFTTHAARTAGAISRYIARRGRLLASEKALTSAFTAVASRYQLKGRVVARGRSNFTAHTR